MKNKELIVAAKKDMAKYKKIKASMDIIWKEIGQDKLPIALESEELQQMNVAVERVHSLMGACIMTLESHIDDLQGDI